MGTNDTTAYPLERPAHAMKIKAKNYFIQASTTKTSLVFLRYKRRPTRR